jgi:hypothetical protein
MSVDFENACSAFEQQSVRFLDLVEGAPDLSAPTDLQGWDCAVLVGHVNTSIEVLWRWRGDPPDGAVELDRISWWDAADPNVNDQFARRYAAKRTHDQLRALVATSVRRANELLHEASPDWTLVPPGDVAWARFDEAIATRVFELTVHGLDLAAATRSPATPDPAALAVTGEILERRLGDDRPADLASDLDWVRAGTGRAPHADARLPVVS